MNRRTKALQFNTKTRERIKERDGGCIFCKIGYDLPPEPMRATDIMHIVNRSQGGLGIEQNGVFGCKYHHMQLDNGNKGQRAEMLTYIKKYMQSLYSDWKPSALTYKK